MRSCGKDDELIMKMTTKEFLENANAEMGRKVWEHYGEEAQTKKLVEELAELITAIAKNDIRAVREEMADVEVMIMQFKQGLNIDTLPIMNYKLNRTMARIENENNKYNRKNGSSYPTSMCCHNHMGTTRKKLRLGI